MVLPRNTWAAGGYGLTAFPKFVRPPPCSMQEEEGLLLPLELDIIYEHVSPIDIPFFSFLSLRKRNETGQLKLIFTLNQDF